MNLKVAVAGLFKTVADTNVFKTRVAGAWKDVEFVRAYATSGNPPVSGWRDIWVKAAATPTPTPSPTPTPTPAPPVVLTVNVVPSTVSGVKEAPGIVTTNAAVAQVSGGTGPYTYQWVLMSWTHPTNTPAFTTPQAVSTTLTQYIAELDHAYSATFKCIVTDSLGNTGQGQGTASFLTTSVGGGGHGGGGDGGWDGWGPPP